MCQSLFAWTGGKRFLAQRLLLHAPASYEVYHEPFFGAGSMFWRLQPRRAVLNDSNPWLMSIMLCLKLDVELLCNEMAKLDTCFSLEVASKRSRKYKALQLSFNTRRIQIRFPNEMESVLVSHNKQLVFELTALFLFLISRAFAGKIVLNAQHDMACHTSKRGCAKAAFDLSKLRSASNRLCCMQSLRLLTGDAQRALELPSKSDFVYADPPYFHTRTLVHYNNKGFSTAHHLALCDRLKQLHSTGVYFVLSGSSPSPFEDTMKEFGVVHISVAATLASGKRQRIASRHEMIVHNQSSTASFAGISVQHNAV